MVNRQQELLLRKHLITAFRVETMMSTGLTAQDILDGVKLPHEEYIMLVKLAQKALYTKVS